jgi:hypothetical protein
MIVDEPFTSEPFLEEPSMEKYDLLVIDLRGERGDEQNRLAEIADKNWTLVSVVSLPLCRRAYFQRKSVEPSEITARREAALRILRNETIEPAERVHLALLIAAGDTSWPPSNPKDDDFGIARHAGP